MKFNFNKTQYESYIKQLDTIVAEENPCQFDALWKCIASRLWKIVWDSCCTKSCGTICEHNGPLGCTTTNILCKTYYCPTAMEWLSRRAQFQIDFLQDYIGYLLWWGNEATIKSFFYQDEATIKKQLFKS